MVRGNAKSDEGAAALCQIGQRDIGVALTRPCSCRAGVPVVWVAAARARPPDEILWTHTGTMALCTGPAASRADG